MALLSSTRATARRFAAAAILIAIGIALVNVAHVVGLVLMESVRSLSLIGTPLAVVVILLLLVS